ncbi:AAA family ATPase [Clostridium sp. AWRP]|uniref:AAA family ATPase n=1 Tax=Clostridium sp. AWRP TaxID=2212991 RepID=UPI000FD7D2A0|nr:AAA family ATPase [Clostridium sp. AWRP]AZV57938.1 DUF2813 domain-containing protein [Clostridium sp. AWRP]
MSKSIFLERLILKNFKGLKNLDIKFSDTTNIYGDNGTGKTSVFDAFTWLLFDKDSRDMSKFDVQPLDKSNNAIHMLETEVEAVLKIDGEKTVFKKVLKEKWIKPKGKSESELKGVTTAYYIDGVPKKQGQYKKKISSIIPEDIFKLVTNPLYFSTSMKWQERKKVLMDILGEVTDENVIDFKENLKPLKNLLINKSIDELKESINASRKKLIKDKESIPARVDELSMTIKEDIDFETLEDAKQKIDLKIKSVEKQIMDKSEVNVEIFKKKEDMYGLKSRLKDIQYEEIKKAESSKDGIEEELCSVNDEITHIKFDIKLFETEKYNDLKAIKEIENDVDNLRGKWYEENNKIFEFPKNARICPLCKRAFSDEDVEKHRNELEENFNKSKAKVLEDITREGTNKAYDLKKYRNRMSENDIALKNAKEKLENLSNKKIDLQSNISSFKVNIDLDSNKEYRNIQNQIKMLEAELCKPIEKSLQIDELKEKRKSLESELEQINHELGYKEINIKIRSRIGELMDQEKILTQQIVELEKQEFMCNEFIKTKVQLMESGINSKFKYVKFRFFKTQVNGGIDEDCEPLVEGVPFSTNLNFGARINAGIDIINTLSNHYKIKAPIFIDNRESTTKLIETDLQIVNLFVSVADKNLRVENTSLKQVEGPGF